MNPLLKRLTVSQAAALCGVSRNTIGAWIRSGKIQADMVGRNYSIPAEELVYFLQSNGRKIPAELGGDRLVGRSFRSMRHCWFYFQDKVNHRTCQQCTVFQNRLDVCFSGKVSQTLICNGQCHQWVTTGTCITAGSSSFNRLRFRQPFTKTFTCGAATEIDPSSPV